MAYLYVFILPIAILIVGYFLAGKPSKNRQWVHFLFEIFKTYFTYALLLYYLSAEDFVNTGLSFVSVFLFTIPLGIIVIPLKVYYFFKKEKQFKTR